MVPWQPKPGSEFGTEQSGSSVAIIEQLILPGDSPWHGHATTKMRVSTSSTATSQSSSVSNAGHLAPVITPSAPAISLTASASKGETPTRLLLICTPAAGFDRFIYQASQPGDRTRLSASPAL